MQQLANYLSLDPLISRPVLDATGMSGSFHFRVHYNAYDTFVHAMEQDLGLVLVPQRRVVEMFVLDRIEQGKD
jgi:uncharacterized protein (TIGR03435 family)